MSNLKDIRPAKNQIMLDRVRTLHYDANALAEIDEHFGSMNAGFAALQNGSIKALRFFLWAALIHEDEELTEKYVGKFVNMSNLSEVGDKLSAAIKGDLPEPEDADEALEDGTLDPT